MSFLLGAALGLMGYCVGKIVEYHWPRKGVTVYINSPVGDRAEMSATINKALTEYIRNHRNKCDDQ